MTNLLTFRGDVSDGMNLVGPVLNSAGTAVSPVISRVLP